MKKGRMTLLLMWLKYKIFLFEKGENYRKVGGGGVRGVGLSKGRETFDMGGIPSCLYETLCHCYISVQSLLSFKWDLVLCWLYIL